MNINKSCLNCSNECNPNNITNSYYMYYMYYQHVQCMRNDYIHWSPNEKILCDIYKNKLIKSQKCIDRLTKELESRGVCSEIVDIGAKMWYEIEKVLDGKFE